MANKVPEGDRFVDQWNALDRKDRLRIRRLVRLGKAQSDPEEAVLALGYARLQLSRPWMRMFWVWFVPGIVMALGVAMRMHPFVVGVVIALGSQSVLTWINLRRTEKVNRPVIGS